MNDDGTQMWGGGGDVILQFQTKNIIVQRGKNDMS